MPEYLKGNYKAPKIAGKDEPKKPEESLSTSFEKQAMERLGGSIAFVMSSKTFLWTEDGAETDDKKDGGAKNPKK